MNRTSLLVGAALVLSAAIFLPSCNVTLVSFQAPSSVVTGATFEVEVTANHSNGNINENAGVVIQVPNGFNFIDGWIGGDTSITAQVNSATFQANFIPEPGHTLISFSGSAPVTTSPLTLRVRLQAPAAPGNYTLKCAIAADQAGVLTHQVPPGINDFAQITAAPEAINISVTPPFTANSPKFVEDITNLPNYLGLAWTSTALGDVNGDGLKDLALGFPNTHVFLRQHPVGWVEASAGLLFFFTGTSEIYDLAFGDFNGDGLDDLAGANGKVWMGNGGASWQDVTPPSISLNMPCCATGDVDGDGLADVAFGTELAGAVLRFFKSNGNGTFSELSNGLPNAAGQGGRRLLMHDMDGDGSLDLVWVRSNSGIDIYLWSGAAWSQVTTTTGLPTGGLWDAEVADVDGDGILDVIATSPLVQNQGVRLYRGNGNLSWTLDGASGLPTNGGYRDVESGDLDGDGILDLIVGRETAPTALEVWQGQGTGLFAPAPTSVTDGLPVPNLGEPSGITVGDINGDGTTDVTAAMDDMGIGCWLNIGASFLGACASGNVGVGGGGPFDVLTLNGSAGLPTRRVLGAVGQNLTFGMAQPPTNPNPADFAVFGFLGIPASNAGWNSPWGNMCLTPLHVFPSPGLFTLANTFGPDPTALLPATQAPWSFTVPGGVPVPLSFTIQGIAVHNGQMFNNLSITNAVLFEVP